jgi:protein O-mannosyl-transferase
MYIYSAGRFGDVLIAAARGKYVILVLASFGLVCAVYGLFLWNPIVFDDVYFFDGKPHKEYIGVIFDLSLRWLPYATFEWTKVVFGQDLIWFRLGNLLLHLANMALLMVFLKNLFELTQQDVEGAMPQPSNWLALLAVTIFAIHPAAVYAVAYLTQRSTLMATFFLIAMLNIVLAAIAKKNLLLLWVSVLAYFLAVMSKEHAVMAPTLVAALMVLLRKRTVMRANQLGAVFFAYLLIAAFVTYQVSAGAGVIGEAYQVNGSTLLQRITAADAGFDPDQAYYLSIITQATLFFKYLLVWVIPSPTWMSVDMYEALAPRLWAGPQLMGLAAYIGYGALAGWLLFQQGLKGLLGFSLLCPWLLFFTEFSTVRIAEPFVIYRSYLWCFGLLAALPWMCQRLSQKFLGWAAIILVIFLLPQTVLRLQTFSNSWLLWDDAERLVAAQPVIPGVERIYFNRGNAASRMKRYAESIGDYDSAIKIDPTSANSYSGRGAAKLGMNDFNGAKSDFDTALLLKPNLVVSMVGLGRIFEGQGNVSRAITEYSRACQLGNRWSCERLAHIQPKSGN